jgi:hypothetical protein
VLPFESFTYKNKKGDVTIKIVKSTTEICLVLELYINDKPASLYDFGLMKDLDPENAPPCGCGNRCFVPGRLSNHILKKYDLTQKQGEDVMELLTINLMIGSCRRCK